MHCKKLLVLGLMLIGLLSWAGLAFAATPWVWIESDANVGKFINPATLKINRTPAGKLDSIDIDAKVVYTEPGAAIEISSYGAEMAARVKAPDLGYSLLKLRLYPEQSRIVRDQVLFYNKKDELVWQDDEDYAPYIPTKDYYASFFYYTLDEVAPNKEYARFKSKDHYYSLSTTKNDDGSEVTWDFDSLALREAGHTLKGYFWQTTRTPQEADPDSYVEDAPVNYKSTYILYYREYDESQPIVKQTAVFYNNGGNDFGEMREEAQTLTIEPGSRMDTERNTLLAYYKDNYNWVHRYEQGVYQQ